MCHRNGEKILFRNNWKSPVIFNSSARGRSNGTSNDSRIDPGAFEKTTTRSDKKNRFLHVVKCNGLSQANSLCHCSNGTVVGVLTMRWSQHLPALGFSATPISRHLFIRLWLSSYLLGAHSFSARPRAIYLGTLCCNVPC